ncbi:hypothetical protein [Streptomyces sp. NBC_00893]|uniref:hypothetical protein n=1 Tax=Streptomyces sp. NBC_00893 TaxID=2975862 RepID=UPI002251FA3A|nr:hypothetical protein [Streptomyces sp. NBC_00893]MCX4850226.1 hypothetical protein [Streptomyces sp. NBC_00893]
MVFTLSTAIACYQVVPMPHGVLLLTFDDIFVSEWSAARELFAAHDARVSLFTSALDRLTPADLARAARTGRGRSHGGCTRPADFGLALSSEFELSQAETDFLSDHLTYDGCYIANHLIRHHLPENLYDGTEHGAFLGNWIAGERSEVVPPAVATVINRHARTAAVLDEFHRRLLSESKLTPYPVAGIERAQQQGDCSTG